MTLYRAPETRQEVNEAELVLVVPAIIDYEAAKRQVAELVKWIRMSEVDIFDAREWSEAILDAAVKVKGDT